jgi:hypothetical protein
MLSGQLPIQAPTAAQLLARHITDPPIPLSKVTMGLPPGVCAAVERCLAKQPQDRYPSASAFFVDLERGCRGVDRNVTAQWVAVDAQGLPVPRTGVEAAAAPRGPVGFTGFGQPASTASTGGFVVQQSAYPTPVRGSGTSQCRPGTYPPQAAPGSYPPQAAPGSYPPQAYPPQAAPGSYPPQAYPPQAAPGSYPPQAYPPQAALGSYPPQVAPGTFAPAPTPQAAADTLAVAPAPAPAPATDRSATTLRQSAGEVMADEDDLDERPASWLPKLLWGLPVLLAIAAMVGWITYARKQTQSDGKETSASAPSGETEDASAPAPGMEAPRPVKVKVEARTVGVVVTVSLPGQPPAVRKVPFELEVKTGDAVVIEGSKAGFETKVESFTAAADRTVVLDLARSGGRRSPPPGGTRPPPGEPPRPRAMDPDPPRERPRIAAMDPPPRREPPRDRPRPGMGSDVGTLRPDF